MNITPAQRKAVYKALAALGALLVVYGLVDHEQVSAWLEVVNAALMLGGSLLAHRNVPADSADAADSGDSGAAF